MTTPSVSNSSSRRLSRPLVAEGDHRVDAGAALPVRLDRAGPSRCIASSISAWVGCSGASARDDLVGERRRGAACATSAGSRFRIVPAAALRGIGEERLARPASRSSLMRSKCAARQVDFAAHFDPAGGPAPAARSGIGADRADVRRHVLAAHAVAARRAAHQPAVLVGQRDAEAVDLQLGDVGDRRVAERRRPCARARRTRAARLRCRRCRG